MPVLQTRVDARSSAYKANREAMQALLDEVLAEQQGAIVAGGQRYIDRHRERGKMLVRERVELLVDRDTALLELHALAAWGTGDPVGGGSVHVIGQINGVECFITGTDMTVRGGAHTHALNRNFVT